MSKGQIKHKRRQAICQCCYSCQHAVPEYEGEIACPIVKDYVYPLEVCDEYKETDHER